MAKAKKAGIPQAVRGVRRGISERLDRLIKLHYGSRTKFATALELNGSTVSGWFAMTKDKLSSIPDGGTLLRFALELGWSPTYILTGEGPETVGASAPRKDVLEEFWELAVWQISMNAYTNPEFTKTALGRSGGSLGTLTGSHLAADRVDPEKLLANAVSTYQGRVLDLAKKHREWKLKKSGVAEPPKPTISQSEIFKLLARQMQADEEFMSSLPDSAPLPPQEGEPPGAGLRRALMAMLGLSTGTAPLYQPVPGLSGLGAALTAQRDRDDYADRALDRET